MNVNIYSLFVLIFVILGLQNVSATTIDIRLNDIPLPECGEKGSKGDPGIPGHKGDFGIPGIPAIYGSCNCDEGKIKATCESIINDIMPPPQKGPRGEPGFPGLTGLTGEMGPEGPPGLPGPPGICQCDKAVTPAVNTSEGMSEFGTAASPANLPCKFAPDGTPSGNYYMGPKGQVFEVYCNMSSKETCIEKRSYDYFRFKENVSMFWISEIGVDLTNIHNLTSKQITWLQSHSASVRQTLLYFCAFHHVNCSNYVQKILTWNEVLIGPSPSEQSPFFYTLIPEIESDPNATSYADIIFIELHSSNVNRLPIIDMLITADQYPPQTINIARTKLCFG